MTSNFRDSQTNTEKNRELGSAFGRLAADKNCSPAQLALAWVLAQGDHIIPIPGTRHRKYFEENAGATDVSLTSSDLNDIETLLNRYPDIGSRYSDNFAKQVDKQ